MIRFHGVKPGNKRTSRVINIPFAGAVEQNRIMYYQSWGCKRVHTHVQLFFPVFWVLKELIRGFKKMSYVAEG